MTGTRHSHPAGDSDPHEMQSMAMPDLEQHKRTEHPLGDDGFMQLVDKLVGQEDLRKKKPRPKTVS